MKVELKAAGKICLMSYVSKGNHLTRAIRRASALLNEGGYNHKQVAYDCSFNENKISNLRHRYREKGIDIKNAGRKIPKRSVCHYYL